MSVNSRSKFSFEAISGARWPFVVLFTLIFLLTHIRQNAVNNYGCEMCADKAGYYVYLSSAFQYGFHASEYPDAMDAKFGYGFRLDHENDKVLTKFTCGVALMQMPFYLAAKSFSLLFAPEEIPFSRFYLLFINIGAAFYCTLGLFFLHRWYTACADQRTAFIAVLIIFFGTHIYYYTLDESLMSHLYSFFLMCTVLFAMMNYQLTLRYRYFLLLAFALALAILIRPTNILFVLVPFFVGTNSGEEIRRRFRLLCRFRNIFSACAVLLLTFLPQMLYWKFAYGQYIAWSYAGEGFFNWDRPWLMTVWFSPQSGLFPYTPLLLLSVLTAFVFIRKKTNSVLLLIVFLLVSYLCASWSNPFFGECNFGKRPFVEYLPLLALPVVWLLQFSEKRSGVVKWSVYGVLLTCTLWNLWLFGAFDTCFQGAQWEWSRFGELLREGKLLP